MALTADTSNAARIPSIARTRSLGTMAVPEVSVGAEGRVVTRGAKRAISVDG